MSESTRITLALPTDVYQETSAARDRREIGAFVEWVEASYLVSDNRHFLHDLQAGAFEVLTPAEFLARLGAI